MATVSFTSQTATPVQFSVPSGIMSEKLTAAHPSLAFEWWTFVEDQFTNDGVGGLKIAPRLSTVNKDFTYNTSPIPFQALNNISTPYWPDTPSARFRSDGHAAFSGKVSIMGLFYVDPAETGTMKPLGLNFRDPSNAETVGIEIVSHSNGNSTPPKLRLIDTIAGVDGTGMPDPAVAALARGVFNLYMCVIDFANGTYATSIDGGQTWVDTTLATLTTIQANRLTTIYQVGRGEISGAANIVGAVPEFMIFTGDLEAETALCATLRAYAASTWNWVAPSA